MSSLIYIFIHFVFVVIYCNARIKCTTTKTIEKLIKKEFSGKDRFIVRLYTSPKYDLDDADKVGFIVYDNQEQKPFWYKATEGGTHFKIYPTEKEAEKIAHLLNTKAPYRNRE